MWAREVQIPAQRLELLELVVALEVGVAEFGETVPSW